VSYLLIFLGGGTGAVLRSLIAFWVDTKSGEPMFPVGTLAVNISGCFIMGLIASFDGLNSRLMVTPEMRQLLLVGLLGGYTTFSAFSWHTLTLMREAQWGLATLNVAGSITGCLVAVYLGCLVGMWVNGLR
jgi:CrcB protein